MKLHQYRAQITWTGNEGSGTSDYKEYNRNHVIEIPEKQINILGSSDPSFLGDQTRYNPEELLVSSLSSCHMLWYLHLCAVNNVIVTNYVDNATGIMEETDNGSGSFKKVTLHPIVTVSEASMIEKANALHPEANKRCFIANSCNFEVAHSPKAITPELKWK